MLVSAVKWYLVFIILFFFTQRKKKEEKEKKINSVRKSHSFHLKRHKWKGLWKGLVSSWHRMQNFWNHTVLQRENTSTIYKVRAFTCYILIIEHNDLNSALNHFCIIIFSLFVNYKSSFSDLNLLLEARLDT